jgi:3-phenylpropionate/cinnamic acid dioxygenase small subunit
MSGSEASVGQVSRDFVDRLEDFVDEEANLADSHQYEEWLALWNPERATYLVPYANSIRGSLQVAIVRDDFARLGARIGRLRSGSAHAQDPPSSLCRVVSRVRPTRRDGPAWVVSSKFVCTESRPGREMELWSGRTLHTIAPRGGEGDLELWRKEVLLTNVASELPPLTFLI